MSEKGSTSEVPEVKLDPVMQAAAVLSIRQSYNAGVLAGLEIARKMAEDRIKMSSVEFLSIERELGAGTIATKYAQGQNMASAVIHQNIAAEIARRSGTQPDVHLSDEELFKRHGLGRLGEGHAHQKPAGSGNQTGGET